MQLTEKQKQNFHEAMEYIKQEFGENAMHTVSDLSPNQIVALKNMWRGRAKAILQVLQNGWTFRQALRNTRLLYDTTGFGEILSRLARARGILLRTAITCCRSPNHGLSLFDSRMSVNAVWSSIVELESKVVGYELAPDGRGSLRRLKGKVSPVTKAISREKVRGAYSFIQKCTRDIPLMPEKTEARPTSLQLAYMLVELGKLRMAIDLIHEVTKNPYSWKYRETNHELDPFGVGVPYNEHLSFLAQYPWICIQMPQDFNADCFLACWLVRILCGPKRPRIQFVGPKDRRTRGKPTAGINLGLQDDHASLMFSGNTIEKKLSVSRKVFDHLLSVGESVERYRPWVQQIEENLESSSEPSAQLARSRSLGVLSVFESLTKVTNNPVATYNAFSTWLDAKAATLN